MSDSLKLGLLLLATIIIASLFITIGLTADNYQYFLSRRVPKVLAIILAAIAIALSSLAFQTITHNRILTPSIMGFDSIYLLVQVSIVAIFGGFSIYSINAYLNFSLSALAMICFSVALFSFYFRQQRESLMTLLLVGLIFGQLFSNVAAFFTLLMNPNDFSAIQSNLFASFNNINTQLVYLCAPLLMVLSGLLFKLHRVLDLFWLDKDNATSLGVDVTKVTKQVLVLSTFMVAISTALVGPIMFFGLLVTNLTRELLTTYQHRFLLAGSAILATCALLSGQWIVENLFHFETTLSVIINFVGGVYFLYLLLSNKLI